jgi:hypothetical protein
MPDTPILRVIMVSTIVALFIGLGSAAARSFGQGTYTMYGYGASSCGEWNADRSNAYRHDRHEHGMAWVLGFVSSGVGWEGEQMQRSDAAAMEQFIDQYCTQHPLSKLSEATRALVEALNNGSH